MYKAVTIVKNPKHLVPEEFFKLAIEQNGSFYGFATNSGGVVSTLEDNEPIVMKDLLDFQEGTKDERVVFCFGESDSKLSPNLYQPFILLKDDKADKTICAAFIDGEFPGFVQEKQIMPPEFFLANTYLAPKLKQMFGYAGSDVAKFADMLRDPIFQKDILAQSERATIALMLSNGELMTLDKNPLRAAFPWGWSSKHFGYKNEVVDQTETTTTKPSLMSRFGRSKASADEGPAKQVTSAPIIEPGKTDTVIPDKKEDPDELVFPPKDVVGNALKAWYQDNFGFKPKDFHNKRPGIPRSKLKLKNFSDLKSAQEQPKAPTADPKATPTEAPIESPAREKVALLSAEERKAIRADFLNDKEIVKAIDIGGQEMMDPTKYKEYEAKVPSIIDQIGITSEDFAKWDLNVLREFARDFPDAAAGMIFNLRGETMYLRTQKVHAPAPEGKTVDASDAPAAVTEQPTRKRFAFGK